MKLPNIMKTKALTSAGLNGLLVAGLVYGIGISAAPAITIGSAQRTGTLDSATSGAMANGTNLKKAVVDAAFSGDWTEVAHLDSSLADAPLSITFTSGGWGDNNVAGTWSIASTFWTTYGSAVLGWHVGEGGGDPDAFMFKVTENATSGTWSYDRLSGGGGGFSNFQLYGKTGGTVPDSGTTIVSLGFALLGLGSLRKFLTSKL
jgi:hypothetical protein